MRRYATEIGYISLGVVLIILLCVTNVPLKAEGRGAIAQGFQTSETDVATGALMSLKPGSPNTVELGNIERTDQLIGVVAEKPLIELSQDSKSVQVVTGGLTLALVSDINGEVKTGDKITASPIAGVGMKATDSIQIVGTAQADLSGAKPTERTITDREGRQQLVRVGLIPVQVNVTFYASPDDRSTFLPGFLQDFANNIAGHQVSPVRVLIAAGALVLAFASILALLYSAVKSSIISIGRNPLSEVAVRKGLLEVGLTIIGILLLTLIAIYLILTT
ncbi:MAG: hypothetical protein ACREGJ_03780 [Candidatus Saccharimonadales bacterium]